MSERMKGFTCCGDCIHYNYKKHKCNLGASVVTDARNPFYDDCPIPDIPSEQEIRNMAIDEFAEKIVINSNRLNICTDDFEKFGDIVANIIYEIAEQMKEVGE